MAKGRVMQVRKYSASGNDFVIFHSLHVKDRSALAQHLCDRHEGVGADGMIVLLPFEGCDFMWEFYNSDGSRPGMCGNGSRAAAHYAFTQGLAGQKMRFKTDAGILYASVEGEIVESQLTPFKELQKPFEDGGKEWFFWDTGVPHLVCFGEYDMEFARKMRYKFDANVNFCTWEGEALHVSTYERGVEAMTQACGTGMVAAFLSVRYHKINIKSLNVIPPSGEWLRVRIDEKERVYLKGSVREVFSAEVFGVDA
jgi:diaminopimelate epimerase